MTKPFYKQDPYVVRAKLYGVFKLLSRPDKCEHKSCGYKDIKPATYKYVNGLYKTIKRVPGPLADCTYDRYAKCTTQELVDPNSKVTTYFAAIEIAYSSSAGFSGEPEIWHAIILHNLNEDSVKDKWFQHGVKESFQPHMQIPPNWIKPSELKNLAEVVEGMKKEL